MMMSGKDFLKSHVLSWRRKVYSDWEDVISSGRAFQVFGPATGKALLPTVDRLTDGTRRRLVHVERLPGRLRTGTSGPRYSITAALALSESESLPEGNVGITKDLTTPQMFRYIT